MSTFNPTANLHSTFPQLASVIPKPPLSNLFLFLPSSPCSKLTHLAYISHTTCCFCPHPVLLLSNDCSFLVRSSLSPPTISISLFSLYLLFCMQNTQHSSCCALTHTALSLLPFPFRSLLMLLFFLFLSLMTHQDPFSISLCPQHQNDASAFP